MWRIFRRRQDAALSEVLARLEALEGRADRQDGRVDEVFRAIDGTCERAGVPVAPRIRLVSGQRDSA